MGERAIAFGVAGLGCIAVSVFLHVTTPALVMLSLAFVAIAVTVLAVWREHPLWTFAGLWLLAIALNAVFWIGVDTSLTPDHWFNLYISTLVGTVAFTVWVLSGLAVGAVRRHARGVRD